MALPRSSKLQSSPNLERTTPKVAIAAPLATALISTESDFATIFLRHYGSLCDFVNSYVHAPDVAEEIVQAVFSRIWEERASWRPGSGARAYLFVACRNQALDYLRHEQIVNRVAETRDIEADGRVGLGQWTTLPSPQAQIEAAEVGEQLRLAVASLPERRRLVVTLRWHHELKNPEIARILGISVKGVEVQFSRALADLRRLLSTRPDSA